jgi:hypothetical protein
MGSESPETSALQQEQDVPLILGSEGERAGASPADQDCDDLALPEEPTIFGRQDQGQPTTDQPSGVSAIRRRLEMETRQLELIQRMEALLENAEAKAIQPAQPTAAPGWATVTRGLLPALGGGIVGGGLLLALLPWLPGRQLPQTPNAQRPGAGAHESAPAPKGSPSSDQPQAQDTVTFRCDQPCWLDIREANNGQKVFSKLLKGTANFGLGAGLNVYSGRADLVKMRINKGAEEPFLPGRVVGSRVIRPTTSPAR